MFRGDSRPCPALAVLSEFIVGQQLYAALRTRLSPPWSVKRARTALCIVVRAAAALQALHEHVGAVHNDPHLGNLLVERRGPPGSRAACPRVVLMDFGRASWGAAVPSEQLEAYPGWAQTPLPASADMALLCAMLVAGQPVAHSWARMADALRPQDPALASALSHLGNDLLPTALRCGRRDDLLQLYEECQASIESRQRLAAHARGPPESCPLKLLTHLRDPANACHGVSPAAWLADPVLMGGLQATRPSFGHATPKLTE